MMRAAVQTARICEALLGSRRGCDDVNYPSTNDRSDDDLYERHGEPRVVKARTTQSISEVAIAKPERQREPDAVGVDCESPDGRRLESPHSVLSWS